MIILPEILHYRSTKKKLGIFVSNRLYIRNISLKVEQSCSTFTESTSKQAKILFHI